MSGKIVSLVGGKAKIGAISLLLLLSVSTGVYFLATNPNNMFSLNDRNRDLPRVDWIPRMPPSSPQSGLNSWMRGESGTEMSQSLGTYIGMSRSNIFGLGNQLATVSEQAVAKLNESDAIDIALSHEKVQHFVNTIAQIETWTYFDGTFWHINFFDSETYTDWAYVMIRDNDALIVQIYIYTADEVYLEWPTANLDASTALGLANENPIVQGFLQGNSLNITDAWVWFDGENSWYVDFYPYILTYAEDASVNLNSQEGRGIQQEWGEILPSQPVEDRLAYGYEFTWLTAIIDDTEAKVRSIYTSYFNFSELINDPDTAKNAARNAPEAKEFWDRHANDFVSQDVYLQFNYTSSDSTPEINWWVDNYAWPQYTYGSEENSNNGSTPLQLPSQVKDVYYWAFDYMSIALTDKTLETVFIYELPQPNHSYEQILQQIMDLNDVSNFLETYQEVWITIAFDPFTSTWWIWILPTWTWMAYAFLEISDDQFLTLNDIWIEDIPKEQEPSLTLDEIRAIFHNSSYYQSFNQTYSKFGEINEYVYYYYDEQGYFSSNKVWTISLYSSVIVDAYLSVSLDDDTGDILDSYSLNPEVLPVHTVNEVLNFTQQQELVQDFLNNHDNVITNIYFTSYGPSDQAEGIWLVYYYTPQYDAMIALRVQDDPLSILEIWTYP